MNPSHSLPEHLSADDEAVAGVPVSAGIAPEMRWFIAISLLIIFTQGAFCAAASHFGRIFPANASTKIPLDKPFELPY